jgi:plastocyanin
MSDRTHLFLERDYLLPLLALALLLGTPAAARAGDIVGRVTAGGRPVRDAVVFVEDLRSPPVQSRAVMDQRNRTFLPHVMAVQVGTRVQFPNHDTVFHNVFSYREGKRFDLGLYPVGSSRVVTFDRPGLVRIFCNIHSNMSAFIWVVENSFFTLTDSSGRFQLADVPAGERSVEVWSERSGSRRLPIRVPRGGSVRVDVPLGAR